MRTVIVVVLALAACHRPARTPAPPHAPPTSAAPVRPRANVAPVDAGTPLPTLTDAQLAAFDSYAAFSGDGLAFAATDLSPGAGVPVLTFHATTTGTIEKRLVLDSPASKRAAAGQLVADGFPLPGAAPPLPPAMEATVRGTGIVITMVGQPVTNPVPAFPEQPGLAPARAQLVAVSNDGKLAAVRVTSKASVGEFGPAKSVRIVKLFR